MLVEGWVRAGWGGGVPLTTHLRHPHAPPCPGLCLIPVLLVCGKGIPAPEQGLLLCLQLQLAALQKFTGWIFNQLFAWRCGVKTAKMWSTGLLGRAQGVRQEPGSLGRLWHAASPGPPPGGPTWVTPCPGLPRDTEPQGFGAGEVAPRWLCWRNLWAMASESVADQSGIALNSQSVALRV